MPRYGYRMDAAAILALALVLVAILARLIASAPLFTTLSICFGNWAEESRAARTRPEPGSPPPG